MIASSTTMPMAIVSASSVKLLIEKPRKYMMANVATIDVGRILALDGLPALTPDDQLPEFPRRLQLAQGQERELPPRRFDAAGGNLDVARVDRAFHAMHGEAPCRQLVGLCPHAHGEAPLAVHPGAADTRQTLQPRLAQAVGHGGALHQVLVRAG